MGSTTHRLPRALIGLLLAFGPVEALAAPPVPPKRPAETEASAPRPEPRPEPSDAAPPARNEAPPDAPKASDTPKASDASDAPVGAAEKEPRSTESEADPATTVRNVPSEDPTPTAGEACRSRLKRLGVRFEEKAAISEGDCRLVDPVVVSAVGPIAVEPPALLACPMAEGVARWLTEVVEPEAAARLDKRVVGVGNASAYVCRPRNGRKGAKLSEHATGNALDIASLTVAGGAVVSVVDDPAQSEPVRGFLKTIRTAACDYFTTVLGPGADEDHGDHFHFDLQVREGGYRLCQ